MKNCSKEMAHLFDLHLEVTTKKNPPTVNQQKALDKFNDFLNFSAFCFFFPLLPLIYSSRSVERSLIKAIVDADDISGSKDLT